MATGTFADKEETDEIRDNAIVNAEVNESGYLILTRHNGSTVNAGYVKGSATPEDVDATPSTLVKRNSSGQASIANPSANSHIVNKLWMDTNVQAAKDYAAALGTDVATADTIMRRDGSARAKVADPVTGGDIVNKTYADALGTSSATASTIVRRDANSRFRAALPSHDDDVSTKKYVDSFLIPTEIPNAVDLNSYTNPGLYYQSENTEAAAGTNYPAPYAGLLEVMAMGAVFIHQRYTVYGDANLSNQRTWTRRYYNSQWSDWTSPDGDSGLITTGVATALTNWTITSQQFRKVGQFISLYLAVTYTGSTITVPANGNITNQNIAQLASGWLPATGTNALALPSSSTGRVAHFVLTNAGLVSIAAVAPGANLASGEDWTLTGIYMC